jgi:hypothetical protein
VNYLSHFIIDFKPGEHYFNGALILPDIAKRWIKTFHHPNPSPFFTPNQQLLLQGCLSHYARDKQFHASSFFERYQHIANETLRSIPFSENVQRKWFIAHVLTELMIDRAFVKKFPHLVDSFYESLNLIDDIQLSGFLNHYGMTDTNDFFTFFNHFRSVKYIYYYADNNKFLYSLGRIMMRVGLNDFNDEDGQLMLNAITQIESNNLSDGEALLTELKEVFK